MSQVLHFLEGIQDQDKIVNLRVMYKSGDDAYFWALTDDFKLKLGESLEYTPVCTPAPINIGLADIIAIYAIRYSTVGDLKAELMEEGYVIAALV